MMRNFLSCLYLFSLVLTSTLSGESGNEWIVHLQTEEQLVPVDLLSIETDSSFSKEYTKALEEVFRFDVEVSGRVVLQKKGTLFTLCPRVEGKEFGLTILSTDQQKVMELEKVALTGVLAEDRKYIHRISDALISAFFGGEGIASTSILYTVRTGDKGKEHSEIWEADYDGGNARKIVDRTSGYCVTPIYIPPKPGSRSGGFVYVSYLTGIPKMYAASLIEGKGRKISPVSGNQLTPAISRQRDQIAYVSDITGNPDLFLQEFSPEKGVLGKPRQIFTAPFAVQSSPSFSPDGTRLAFVSSKGGAPGIYMMSVPAPKTLLKEIRPLLITKINRENTAPCWSPDGKKIIYSAMTQGVRQVWVYDLQTGKERQVTQGPLHKENPVFAPDSFHVMYNTSETGACALYLVNLKQSKPVKIVGSERGDVRFPAWGG